MENQTTSIASTSNALAELPALKAPSTNTGCALRFTAKQLKHPESWALLREGFAPFDLAIELPFTADNETIEGKIANQLLGEKVKELVQLKERASWIAGATPYNPSNGAEVMQWWLSELGKVTTLEIGHALFSPVSRATPFGAKRWENWLKEVFLAALDAYYSSQGQEVLSKTKRSATLALMKQGRNMAAHNKAAFGKRFLAMLESPDSRVMELVATDESQAAFNWLTSEKEEASSASLEI